MILFTEPPLHISHSDDKLCPGQHSFAFVLLLNKNLTGKNRTEIIMK